jgi:hypothetical protein
MAAQYCGNQEQKHRVHTKTGDPINSNVHVEQLYSPIAGKDSLLGRSKNSRIHGASMKGTSDY